MSKFVLTADVHIHNWTAFASLNEEGLNNRLLDTVQVLPELDLVAKEINADGILIAGDLLHVARIDCIAYDLMVRALEKVTVPVVMIPGNHDEASKMERFHTMRALHRKDHVWVLDKHRGYQVNLGKVRISGIPFQPSNELLLKKLRKLGSADILMLHTGFAHAVAGADYIADQKEFLKPQVLREVSNFNFAISGHFHQPQLFQSNQFQPTIIEDEGSTNFTTGAILIPGAPLQHNFGDMHSTRGCWILDTTKRKLTFRPFKFPKFYKFDLTNPDFNMDELPAVLNNVPGNFVSLVVGNKEDADAMRERLGEARAFTIQIKKKTHTKSRMKINLEMGRKKLLKLFMKSRYEEDEKLLGTGLRLLKKADEELAS